MTGTWGRVAYRAPAAATTALPATRVDAAALALGMVRRGPADPDGPVDVLVALAAVVADTTGSAGPHRWCPLAHRLSRP